MNKISSYILFFTILIVTISLCKIAHNTTPHKYFNYSKIKYDVKYNTYKYADYTYYNNHKVQNDHNVNNDHNEHSRCDGKQGDRKKHFEHMNKI